MMLYYYIDDCYQLVAADDILVMASFVIWLELPVVGSQQLHASGMDQFEVQLWVQAAEIVVILVAI